MVNPFQDIDWRPDRAARQRFGRSLVIGFPIVGALLSVILRLSSDVWQVWPWWMAAAGTAAGVTCWIVPAAAWPLYVLWYALGASIGIVVSNTLLAVTWLLTIVPIGLIMRAVGRDPMKRRFDRETPTYWRPVENPAEPERYFRQF